MSGGQLEFIRKHVVLGKESLSHTASMDFPGSFPGEDLAWDLERFKQDFRIVVTKLEEYEMHVDLIGIDASIANALRRIMLSHVPVMAIENVFFFANSTVMHDEIMAQRLGLIPIRANPDEYEYRQDAADELTDGNTLVFSLHVKCVSNPAKWGTVDDQGVHYVAKEVLSKHLVFVPQGGQAERYSAETAPRPVHDDIVITKMKPGQELRLEAHCHKGVGIDHAKFSPVATASYRLLPAIYIREPITGQDAYDFQGCFPAGVIAVEPNADGVPEAVVANPRKDTVSREVLRHPHLADRVTLARVRDHFIFSIESTGVLPAAVIFKKAVQQLVKMCQVVKAAASELRASGQASG